MRDSLVSTAVPPVIRPQTSRAGWWMIGGVVVALALATLFWFDPARHAFYPRCLLYTTTGLQCPGCGALRATHQLLHGHFLTALRFNALLVFSIPLVGWFAVFWAWRKIEGKPRQTLVLPAVLIRLGFGTLIAFSILRNLPWFPFTYLAPH